MMMHRMDLRHGAAGLHPAGACRELVCCSESVQKIREG